MQTRSKGIILSYLNTVINMVCGLVLSSYLLRVLGDTEYGIYQTIASFANYLVLLEFGMGTVMLRNISMCRGAASDNNEIERNMSTIWTLTCLLSMVIVVISVLFYVLIPVIYTGSMSPEQTGYAQQMLVFITGYLVFSFLTQTLNGAILAFEDYGFAPLQNIARTVLRLIILVSVLTEYHYAILIAVTDLLLSIGRFGISYYYCRKKSRLKLKFGVCEKQIVKVAAPLAAAIFLQSIVNQANNNVDKFLIGIMLTPESVAQYSVPLYIFSIFSSLTTIPISMYAPSVTQKVAKGISGEKLTEQLIGPCRMTALIGGMVLFGFAAVGRQFVRLVYGEAYLAAWPIAIILMAPMYVNMVSGVLVNVLDALNKRMARSGALMLTTVMNIILTVFWLKRWGVVGAALATAVCTLAGQVILMGLYYKKALGIPIMHLYFQAFRGILPFLILGCVVSGVLGKVFSNDLLSFVICGVVFVGIAASGYLLFGALSDEKAIIARFLRRRKHRG